MCWIEKFREFRNQSNKINRLALKMCSIEKLREFRSWQIWKSKRSHFIGWHDLLRNFQPMKCLLFSYKNEVKTGSLLSGETSGQIGPERKLTWHDQMVVNLYFKGVIKDISEILRRQNFAVVIQDLDSIYDEQSWMPSWIQRAVIGWNWRKLTFT